MPAQVTNYKCPTCTGPLHFVGASGKLECDYCGASYDVAQIEALYAEKEGKAAAAQQSAEEKAAAEKKTAEGSEWDMSDLSTDWGAEGEGMKAYNCPSCGAQLICDATTAATSCPYCGNPTVVPGQFAGTLKPDFVIPFKLSREDAIQRLKPHYKGKVFLPNAKTMGLLYCSSEVNSEIQANQAKKHAASIGLSVVEKTVSSVNDIQQVAESMLGQVDFIYVPTDNVLASSIPTLVKVTDPAKIPVLVGADSMARDGALASLSVDFYKSGVQAGHMAAQILDGKIKPEETPVEDPEVYEVIINKKNAEILGIKIPDEYKNATMVD